MYLEPTHWLLRILDLLPKHAYQLRFGIIVYAGLLFITAYLFLLTAFSIDLLNGYTVYPFARHFYELKRLLACGIIPASIGMIYLLRYALNLKNILHPLIMVALFAANVMACCSWLIGIAIVDKEKVNVQFEGRSYNVISSSSEFGDEDRYWVTVYECDLHNLLCRQLVQQTVRSTDAALIPNLAAHTVTLTINGEAVYVHEVK